MAPRWIWVVLAVLVVLMICPTTYQRVNAQNSLTITLTNSNGTCQQNGSTGVIQVTPTTSVTYQASGNTTPFQVSFSSCPFATCPINQSTGAQTPSANANGTYNYSAMSVNGQSCNNVSSMGLRVKP